MKKVENHWFTEEHAEHCADS